MSKHKYTLGTQDMLDAAKDDATKLPFNTVFVTGTNNCGFGKGVKVIRCKNVDLDQDGKNSVRFVKVEYDYGFNYIHTEDLLPATQKKQKRIPWQNGTQEDLDKAKGNALKIPKKTYFKSLYGDTKGMKVYRVSNQENCSISILMCTCFGSYCDYHSAEQLEPICEDQYNND